MRIFIVDDDELILKSLARVLRRPGYEVVAFGSAEEVLARVGEGPDLLICDYHLPRVNGLSVIQRAKATSPKTRTMLLSGGVEDEQVSAALQARTVDCFANKPWRQDELLGLVDGLLGAARQG